MKSKKMPMRLCAGCNEMKPKKELVRVVRDKEGNVSLDLTGKKSGRGAYVCPDVQCLRAARKTKRIERSLSTPEIKVVIPDEVYEQMEGELSKNE